MIRDISKLMFFMCMCTVEGASELLDDFDDVWHVGKTSYAREVFHKGEAIASNDVAFVLLQALIKRLVEDENPERNAIIQSNHH